MNRSVLIVIVDFLLISLLAFSRLDDLTMPEEKPGQAVPVQLTMGDKQDVMDVLKVSLDKERESREELNEKLRATEEQLQTKEQVLSDREKLIREAEQLLRQKAEEAARLARERSSIEQQFNATQMSVAELQRQLTNTLTEASRSRQNFEAIQNDLRAREQEEAILKRRLAELERNRQAAEEENQQLLVQRQELTTQLQLSETEKRLVREQLNTVQGTVEIERQEKAKLQEHATKLAEGVSALAEKSGELTQEIRENRPLAPNTIFHEFVTNRVRADFRAVRSGVFGREINREKEAKTVLVRQGNQVYGIYHVNDTPLSLSIPGIDWDWLIGNLRRGAASVRIDRISFLAAEPRVVVVPVSDQKARELGSKVYSVPKDPFKFQEAILVGADEGYYGECRFQLDAENPQYIRIQRERFSWLVGKFAPSSGDLVFTKGGELFGLMVNKEYCYLLTDFAPAYHIETGIGIGAQQTGQLLAQLYSQVSRMPMKLQ